MLVKKKNLIWTLAFFIFKTFPKNSKWYDFIFFKILQKLKSNKVQWFIGLELTLNHISLK